MNNRIMIIAVALIALLSLGMVYLYSARLADQGSAPATSNETVPAQKTQSDFQDY